MNIPFFPNLDKNHCTQACVKMILKYYYPEKDFSFEQIDKLFGFGKKILWSCPSQAVVVLDGLGLKAKWYGIIDVEEFLKEGEDYIKKNSKDWKTILEHMDVNLHMRFTKESLKRNLLENKKLTFEDVESFFRKGNIICLVTNVNVLKDKEGYQGHIVLITDIGEDFVEIHNPGLPPKPNEKINKEKFIQSWYYPDTGRYALIVFGKK